MYLEDIEKIDLGKSFYNLKDKLWEHVLKRSEVCFAEAERKRECIKTKEELKVYADKMREVFIDSLGGIPYDKSLPLNAQTVDKIDEADLVIEKVIFESRPKVYVTANLYIPKKRKEPCGAVLFQLGHSKIGKFSGQYQRVARAIASVGLIVLVTEPAGQGERISYYESSVGTTLIPPATPDHQHTGEQCLLVGDNIARYFIADSMRAVDYLESRPEVDNDKIGATGSSGGGTMTCYMMLCDPRIKAAAPGTYLTTRRDYLYAGGAQDSEQIWYGATEKGFDHHEFLLCFAPKPVRMLAVESDFFPIEGTYEIYSVAKRFYDMFGKADNLQMTTDKSTHAYTDNLAVSAASFFAFYLSGEEKTVDRSVLKSLPEKSLSCTSSGKVRVDFEDAKFVFEENKERFNSLVKPAKPLSEFLKEAVFKNRNKSELRLRTFATEYGCGLKVIPHLWFSQPQMPNMGLRFSRFDAQPKDTVICLWDNGTDSVSGNIYKIREITESGKAALVIDLTGMGKCFPNKLNLAKSEKSFYGVLDRLTKDLLFLGDSLCALRLFELDYAVEMAKKEFGGEVSIYAEGVSAIYAKLYKEMNEGISVETSKSVPDYAEIVCDRYYENYNMAGILIPGIAGYFKK